MFLTADDAQRIWRSQTQCQFQLCYAAAATVAAASVTVVAVADSIATTAATMGPPCLLFRLATLAPHILNLKP